MIQTDINLIVNNSIIPFQNIDLEFIKFNKLFATQSVAEHGLGFLINIYEIKNHDYKGGRTLLKKIIFDMGSSNKTFLHNIDIRAHSLYDADMILISHWHYDHVGAFYQILERIDKEIPVICHESARCERLFKRSKEVKNSDLSDKERKSIIPLLSSAKIVNQPPIDENRAKELKGKLIFSKDDYEILNTKDLKIIISGEIPRVHPEEDFHNFYSLQDGVLKEDLILDDKCVIFEFSDHVVLLLGCCHSGIMNTLDYVKGITDKPISHVIGGFHMVSASDKRIKHTIEYLESFQDEKNKIYLFPIHCSGEDFLFKLRNLKKSNLRAFNSSIGTCFTFYEK